jgi:AcrR family transcriptional regulator
VEPEFSENGARALNIIEAWLSISPPTLTAVRRPPAKTPKPPEKSAVRGRPPSIDGQQLLAVARQVFLERGIRATTLEVAKRAGVSEGAVFHRFKSKEGLFSAAMDFDHEEAPNLLLKALGEVEGLELRDALVKVSTAILDVGRVALPIMMMSWSNPEFCGPSSKKRSGFRAFLKAFAAYFDRQMDGGRLRRVDSEVLARALIGSLHHYCLTRILLEESGEAVIPEGMFVRGLVDLLLNGAAASEHSSEVSNRRVSALERKVRSD